MRYWWVNLGDSYEEVRKLGALWAPLKDKRGYPKSYWDSLDLVRRGDIVLHYANKKIRAISSVTQNSRIAEKTLKDKSQWQDLGREVVVEIQDFDFTIDISEIPPTIKLNSGTGIETPFDRNGKVKEGYLFQAPTDVVKFVFQHLRLAPMDADVDLNETALELFGDFSSGTDKAITTTFRREQRALRQHLIGSSEIAQCGICGKKLSRNLLVASHIKPRSYCTEKERIDPHVAMLACVLGCDALFDKGAIYIDEEGHIRPSGKLNSTPDLDLFLQGLVGKRADAFSANSRKYFEWHKKNMTQTPNLNEKP
jgi:hypothetical protein